MNRVVLSLAAFLLLVVNAGAAATPPYYEVTYSASTTEGELSLGVTYTLWVPPDAKRLRGVIVHQHGCGTGACKGGETAAYDLHWQALAAKWDCALLGPSYHQKDGENCRNWCDPRNGSAKTFLRALDDFASQAKHEELKTVPWCLWGHSGGAFWASLMQVAYPERIVAIWFRSGSAFPYWEKGEITKPEIPAAAYGIPMMVNPGAKEKGDKRFDIAYSGGLAMCEAYRKQGALVGFAPDPRTAHECGDSRYLAIPFFDACLALRLPAKESDDATLKKLDARLGFVAPLEGTTYEPAASYKSEPEKVGWLPNENVAKAWVEYVKTGATPDDTPPAAPTNVTAAKNREGQVELSWNAAADLESGLGGFVIMRDGKELAALPEKPNGRFGRPLFQGMSYHDTPEAPLALLRFVDAKTEPEKKHEYRVVAVNSVGLKSQPSGVAKETVMQADAQPRRFAPLPDALAASTVPGNGACPCDAPATSDKPQAAAAAASPAKRWNILFCFADDWGRYAGAYAGLDKAADGSPRSTPCDVVKTPNIDRLAREGVLFRNAFVTSPSCTPCRSSLLSGQYFFRTGRGAILNGAVWDPAIPSFPILLHDAGYWIGETYKVWSPGTPNDAPFGAGKFAYEKAGGAYNRFSYAATKLVDSGATPAAAREKLLDDVRGNFDAFLADAAKSPEQPWCYWFGPTLVHRKWLKGSGKALWGIEPDALKGKLPGFLPDVPEIREDFADYLGTVQAWDAGVGEILKRLEASGQLERTLIVVSGDHGAPGFPNGKCNLYDFGTNVALLARVPGGKGGRIVDDFVNLMDLAPTFLEVGGVKPTDAMTGKSLLDVLKSEASGQIDPTRNWVVTGRERHVASARAGNLPYPQRALRTKEFLYIRNFRPERGPLGDPLGVTADSAPSADALENETYVAFPDMDASPTKAWLVAHRNDARWKPYYDRAFAKRPAEELYDLAKDPDQLMNVAGESAYAAKKQELAERLMKTLTDAADPRVVGAGETFERPPFTEPREPVKKKARQ
jgi:N-sulfoglucosamine sulfohydrolase